MIQSLSCKEFPQFTSEVVQLFCECFGRQISPAFLEWAYLQRVRDNDCVATTMRVEEQLVASYSTQRLDLREIDGGIKSAALSMTTMTHPSYSGQGVFPKLASIHYGTIKEQGVEIVLGFPNLKSFDVFAKQLNWRIIAEIPTLKLVPTGLAYANDQDDTNYSTCDESTTVDWDFHCPDWLKRYQHFSRTSSQLQWRYVDHPENEYRFLTSKSPDSRKNRKITGYCVFKLYQGAIDVVDFVPSGLAEAESFVNHLIGYGFRRNLGIRIWMPPHLPFRRMLVKKGFTPTSETTFFGGLPLVDQESEGEPMKIHKWFLQMGDSDVY